METSKHGDLIIHHYSDFCGEVRIVKRSTDEEMRIEGRDLLTLISWWATGQRITQLEESMERPWEALGVEPWEQDDDDS